MQRQGETLKLELEKNLRTAFPHDEIVEVKTGQRGADVPEIRTLQLPGSIPNPSCAE